MHVDEDAAAEKMAEDISEAMKPIREWFDLVRGEYPLHFENFERAHEDAEVRLMKILDDYYKGGYKDGAAEERLFQEYNEERMTQSLEGKWRPQ